jgi:hypothetical protein
MDSDARGVVTVAKAARSLWSEENDNAEAQRTLRGAEKLMTRMALKNGGHLEG